MDLNEWGTGRMTSQVSAEALLEFRNSIGDANVITDSAALAAITKDTGNLSRRVTALLKPQSEDDVRSITQIASEYRLSIAPFSTGRNWGYGTSNPSAEGCALVDLSGMARILEFDADLGLVTVEPGVTQRQLAAFLEQTGFDFLVPVTGAGPDCSLIGNALERGYGITPIADHFGACTRIRAVLADGSVYDSSLSALGGDLVDKVFKWGVGPYIDGLFTQSNLGIVTQMTIALARRPESVLGFFFGVPREQGLESAVSAIQRILQQTHGTVGSINLMNRRRVLSMVEPYPTELGAGDLIPDERLAAMAKRNQVMIWTGAGALYGNRHMVAAAKRVVKKELRGTASRLVFFSPRSTHLLKGLSQHLPGQLGASARNIFETLDKTLQLLAGAPSEIALPLCYWKSGTRPPEGQPMDPARDGCGLYWYSPLVPMVPEKVREYTNLVEEVCRANRIEPLITLTSLSDKCWDSTVPILFEPQDAADSERAKQCYRQLFETGQRSGFVPYRSHVETMDWFVKGDSAFWQTAAKIKDALDPDGIISPGRYSLR